MQSIWCHLVFAQPTAAPQCGAPIAGGDTPAIKELKTIGCNQARVSDKFNDHNYDMMYGMFLMPLRFIPSPKIMEIGLGCNMNYGPGASAKVRLETLSCRWTPAHPPTSSPTCPSFLPPLLEELVLRNLFC